MRELIEEEQAKQADVFWSTVQQLLYSKLVVSKQQLAFNYVKNTENRFFGNQGTGKVIMQITPRI
jgi:hypothetical protein